jgi:hypothetical protein
MIIPSVVCMVFRILFEYLLLLFIGIVNNNNTNVSLLNFAIAIAKCIRGFTCGVCECAF